MIYTLQCVHPENGAKETYRYDSCRNIVMTEDGNEVDFAQDERFRINPRFLPEVKRFVRPTAKRTLSCRPNR